MVAAGINLANVIAPREKSEAAVATPGLLINLGFGTFVESAYPFMFANKIVFGSAIFWAGMGGMMLGFLTSKGWPMFRLSPHRSYPTMRSRWPS